MYARAFGLHQRVEQRLEGAAPQRVAERRVAQIAGPQHDALGHFERDHAEARLAVEDHCDGRGIGPGVELRKRRRIAALERAAHPHDLDVAQQLGVVLREQRQVGERPQRDDAAHAAGVEAVAQYLVRAPDGMAVECRDRNAAPPVAAVEMRGFARLERDRPGRPASDRNPGPREREEALRILGYGSHAGVARDGRQRFDAEPG